MGLNECRNQALAPGADDRIKAPFAGKLLKGLLMDSTPDEFIRAHGQAALDEECEWPGFSGRILAWREPHINIAIEFEYSDRAGNAKLRSYTACLIGCIGAWRNDHPEVFAPIEVK